jgi:hypothetical protein
MYFYIMNGIYSSQGLPKFYHQKQAAESAAEVIRLKGMMNALQIQLQII